MSEEMFIKESVAETTPKAPKAKKQLSERQLEGLKKGRERMAEKRKEKKVIENKKKALMEMDKKVVEENTSKNKKERKEKKEKIADSEEKLSFAIRKERGEKSLNKFNKIKLDTVDKIKSMDDLKEFETIMGGVSNDMAKNPEKLYAYLEEHANRLTPNKKANKKSNLSLIVE
jgi:hypothetical protein